jgi:hypothetical protein
MEVIVLWIFKVEEFDCQCLEITILLFDFNIVSVFEDFVDFLVGFDKREGGAVAGDFGDGFVDCFLRGVGVYLGE